MGGYRHGREFAVGDLEAEWVAAGVAVCAYFQPFAVGGRANQVDHDLVAGQWSTAPVEGDCGEQSVLDLVPFRGAGREVADGDRDAGSGGEFAEFDFPQPSTVAVGTAGVGGDQQPGGARVGAGSNQVPPAADG